MDKAEKRGQLIRHPEDALALADEIEDGQTGPRRQRKPSIATLIKRAEKAGRPVTSITLADGTTLHFGEPTPSEASNPWLADLPKVKQ
jgi:hypothetical protein